LTGQPPGWGPSRRCRRRAAARVCTRCGRRCGCSVTPGRPGGRIAAAGSATISHNHADDEGFVPAGEVRGRRALLVDGTFTTGARLQSAASALQLAGARVVAAVAIGRVVTVAWSAETERLWRQARRESFSFEICCMEDAPGAQRTLDLS